MPPTLLLVATAASALVNWWSRLEIGERRQAVADRLETVTKPLVTIGVILVAVTSDAPRDIAMPMVFALVLCLIGDVALLPVVDRFVVGLAAFLLGHLVAIVSFLERGLDRPTLGGIALILAALLMATVGNVIVKSATRDDAALRRPVLAYLVVISAMAAVGWATGDPLVIAGSTAFVVSDAVLGWRQFVRPLRHGGLIVMVTYHAAIGLLALSLW
ncbi:MAG: lysoplasmalogenase [Ilumatobacteraceae bacterium]